MFQQMEFEWVLNQEVHTALHQIHQILVVRMSYMLFDIFI